MANPTRYDPAKHYTLSGQTLNALYEQLEGCKLLEAPGYKVDRSPGLGQKLKLNLTAAVESIWDLIPGETEGTHILRAPLVVAGIDDLGTEIEINNDEITLVANKWVCLEVDDLTTFPYTLTLTLIDAETDGGAEVYTFAETTNVLTAAYFPIWRLTDEPVTGAIQYGTDLYAKRYLSGEVQALASQSVAVPGKPVIRFVPRIIEI